MFEGFKHCVCWHSAAALLHLRHMQKDLINTRDPPLAEEIPDWPPAEIAVLRQPCKRWECYASYRHASAIAFAGRQCER